MEEETPENEPATTGILMAEETEEPYDPYPCPSCKTAMRTQDMDQMGSVCPNCFYNPETLLSLDRSLNDETKIQ